MTLEQLAHAGAFGELTGVLRSCQVDDFRADFVHLGFYPTSPWRNYWHRHSFYEVCLAYGGAGRFSAGQEHHEVGAGDVFVARPGVVHEIESSRAEPLGIVYWGFTLLEGRPGPLPGERGWWSGLTDLAGPAVSRSTGSLASLVAALAEQAVPLRSGYQAGLTGLGTALVVETARAFAPEEDLRVAASPGTRLSPPVVLMRRYLADNLARPVTVRDVAAAAHLSARHAERLFLAETGSSLMASLRRMRLDLAAMLLLDSATGIADIARSCGYLDTRAFTTAFRRHHGHPPAAHRTLRGTLHL
ncbi:helix-turn-helix domain-containing protein [Kitasatospora sp. NPDC086009]|uniref:helix-turn-helix domain-containing protein n=1 Tax=unclassified Kitasatospora TaxID=2633591 RepID=UPI0037C66272